MFFSLKSGITGFYSPFTLMSHLECPRAGPDPPISCQGMEEMRSNSDLKGEERGLTLSDKVQAVPDMN